MRIHAGMIWGLLLLGGVAPSITRAQFQSPSPQELSITSVAKAPGAPAVYLYREEIDDDTHSFRTIYARIKVLTEEGKDAAIVHIQYPTTFVYNALGSNSSRMGSGTTGSWSTPSLSHIGEDQPWDTDSYVGKVEVGALEGRVIQPDGTIVPFKGKAADLLKTVKGPHNENVTTFTMPDVKVGSIIEYRYQVRYDRFLAAPDWHVQAPYFTQKAHFLFRPTSQFLAHTYEGVGVSDAQLKDPHDNVLTDIRAAEILPPGKSIVKNVLGERVLDLTDIPAAPDEPYSPPKIGQTYQVSFFYTYTPDAKDFWQKEMNYWTKKLNLYIEPTSLLQNTVKETVAPTDPPLVKARKLYELVQKLDNIDSSPDGWLLSGSEWIPEGKVDNVLQQKKGTSNEIAFLYLGLCRIAGLNARPERVASRSHRIFNVGYQNNEQLDSVLIGVNVGGKEVLVDPGTRMAPFGTLHWSHAGAGGVALAFDGKVETVLTQLQKNSDNTVVHVGTVNVDAHGGVSGTVKIAFIGQQAIQLRQLGVKSGVDAVKQKIQTMIDAEVPKGVKATVDHVAFLEDPEKQLLAVVPVSGSIAGVNGNRLTMPRVFFESQEKDALPADDNRTFPIDMRYPVQNQEQITYLLPAGYSLEAAPADSTIRSQEDAAYLVRSKANAQSLTTSRVLVRGFTLLPAKDYTPLRDFYQKVVAADRQQLVLTSAQAKAQ